VAKKRVFVSFDYDHDAILKTFLVGQAALDDSPFEMSDWSIKEPIDVRWKEKARERIRSVDLVCVIAGEHTNSATGVAAELAIAQDEKVPYFILKGYRDKACKLPQGALSTDKLYNWTWPNLKALIGGSR
jgi:hypothetical protein